LFILKQFKEYLIIKDRNRYKMIYAKSKIYKLVSSQTEKIYIGSTTKTLAQRLAHHKYDMKTGKTISSSEILKFNDCKIILIENYNCNTVDELRAKEYYWICKNKDICVNLHMPTKTQKDWYNENKTRILEKLYIKYQAEQLHPIKCCCGSIYMKRNGKKHLLTQKHLKYSDLKN